ncbi:MAG: hypothetical protein ACFUZC_16485 [Chthoniobacteraceae bacterium]
MIILAIVARISTEPNIRLEYVLDPDLQPAFELTAEPVIEWTTDRKKALEIELSQAEELAAKIGRPAYAMIISSRHAHIHWPARKRPAPSPDEVYRKYERENLA